MRSAKFILPVVALYALVGCMKDVGTPPRRENRDFVEVVITMNIPRSHITRAIGEAEECTVETLDVLVFRVEGGSETFVYSAQGVPAEGNVEGAENQQFSVNMQVETFQQRIVVIANARSQVEALLNGADLTGVNKNTMLAGLRYNVPLSTTGWNSTSPSDFASFPMWGESVPEAITAKGVRASTRISLLRMVARIDVVLDGSIPGQTTNRFRLKSVGVYNVNSSGLVVPTPSNVQKEIRGGAEYVYVTAPSLPAGVMASPPLTYTDFTSPGKPDLAIRGVIYVPETKWDIVPARTPCLIIGGIYQNDSQESFYRIDFYDANNSRIDILRNNLYEINIVRVRGPGHPTLERALESTPIETPIEAPMTRK